MTEFYSEIGSVDLEYGIGGETNGGAIHIPAVTDVWDHAGHEDELWFDWLVDEEDRTTLRVLELIHGAEKARTVISKESLHIVNHAFYSALSENIIHAKSVEELNATTEVISTFFNAGWEKYRTL